MPNSAKQVNTAVNVLSTILGMSSANLGHVQLPAFQKQTKQATVVTHRRNIEEMMLKQGLSVASQIVLLFDKSECLNSDSRASHPVCIAAHHKSFTSAFQSCEAVQLGRVESLPLMPVSEFYDYDDTSKPGPAEREQKRTLKHDSGCFLPPFSAFDAHIFCNENIFPLVETSPFIFSA